MHAIEGGKGKCLTLIQVRVLREVRDKTKPFLSKNEAWYSHVDQWFATVRES